MKAPFPTPVICPVVIGRVQEVAHLRMLVDRAQSGEGQVALVCGEAGIGKSRLVAEVKTEAVSRDFLLMQGSCFPTDHAIPYAPLLDLLRSHFSSHSSALTAPEARPAAQAFLPLLPDLCLQVDLLRPRSHYSILNRRSAAALRPWPSS